MNLNDKKVAIHFTGLKNYPSRIPFDPPQSYPEYKGKSLDSQNHVYHSMREMFFQLGLDENNYNSDKWNPLKEIIEPGMTVFIKPNLVAHVHLQNKDIFSIVTHASILRPILDYVCLALRNKGKIIIGDSQSLFGQFDKTISLSKIKELLEWYQDQTTIPIECMDLRMNRAVRTWLYGQWGRVPVQEDSRGYVPVNLGNLSYFKDVDPKRLRIAIANHKNMHMHHSHDNHIYILPGSFLESDVVISIPKLKTHRRTAVTLALKNFMGVPSYKDSLPHFITGSVDEGGDQYLHPSLRKRICTSLDDQIQSHPLTIIKFVCAIAKKLIWNSHKLFPFKDNYFEGKWYGNDTLWRTIMDLSRIVFYSDKDGKICESPQRNFFCIIDGVIAGEKKGPRSPNPVHSGVLLAGHNPVTIDAVAATLMGFDIDKIPIIKKALEDKNHAFPVFFGNRNDIQVTDGERTYNLHEFGRHYNLKFEAHPNWKGHVELL